MKIHKKIFIVLAMILAISINLSAVSEDEKNALTVLYKSTDGDNWLYNENWNVGDPCTDGWHGVECYEDNIIGLSLYENQLTGSIPPEIGNLTNLTFLGLYKNQLAGSIPPEIGNLTNLTFLYLSYNLLTGSIPSAIGNLTNLTELVLHRNQFTGSIPPEIGNLTNLTVLVLSYNQLTGSIPPEIGNLTNLTELVLHHNLLTGSIPPEIGNLTNLGYLNLESNHLSGEIPSTIIDTNLYDDDGLWLNTNCNLYSSNSDVQDFIVLKSFSTTYEEFLATQGNCPSEVRTLPPLIMYLLN